MRRAWHSARAAVRVVERLERKLAQSLRRAHVSSSSERRFADAHDHLSAYVRELEERTATLEAERVAQDDEWMRKELGCIAEQRLRIIR